MGPLQLELCQQYWYSTGACRTEALLRVGDSKHEGMGLARLGLGVTERHCHRESRVHA